MNENMRNFFAAYLEWAEADAPESDVFMPEVGLCANLDSYLRERTDEDTDSQSRIRIEFANMLFHDYGDVEYPFGEEQYDSDYRSRSHHKHDERLDWLRGKLNL